VHLGTDQIQHVEPPTLIVTGHHQMRHAADDLQKWTGTELIYSGPDVVQNQYQDRF